MNAAKIQLSQKEMEMVVDPAWILTKNAIMGKARVLLEIVQEKQIAYLKSSSFILPDAVTSSSPKISRGENYKGLPYLILDYPRCFDQVNIFAIRSMFWWGNFFSITLHLSGSYHEMFAGKIKDAYSLLKEKGFSCCIQNNEWEHHFEKTNYVPVATLSETVFHKQVQEAGFVKLAQKISLEQWDDAPALIFTCYKLLVEMLLH